MKILAIDTTTKFLCLGAYDGKNTYEYSLETGQKLSKLLIPIIMNILESLNWNPREIDYFACGIGPGSFTGTRIGVSTVKGMSWALKKPAIGVPTLDILAKEIMKTDAPIVPVIDAKRGLIYCAIYKNNTGALKRTSPYMLLGQDEFLRKAGKNGIFFADGAGLYKEMILGKVRGAKILDRDYWYPKAHNIISLALEKIKNKKTGDSFSIKPIYLYPKDCQVKR